MRRAALALALTACATPTEPDPWPWDPDWQPIPVTSEIRHTWARMEECTDLERPISEVSFWKAEESIDATQYGYSAGTLGGLYFAPDRIVVVDTKDLWHEIIHALDNGANIFYHSPTYQYFPSDTAWAACRDS